MGVVTCAIGLGVVERAMSMIAFAATSTGSQSIAYKDKQELNDANFYKLV